MSRGSSRRSRAPSPPAVVEAANRAAGAGPDLVLLHGWGFDAGVWDDVVPMLAMHLRVHALDLPGHGAARDEAPASLDAAVDAIARRIPEGCVVCGWSMGGLVAQRLARRHPARVRRLALLATTPRFLAGPDWPHGMRTEVLDEFARDLASDRDATLATFVTLNTLQGARDRPSVRQLVKRVAARPPSGAALENGLAWLRETDLRADAAWLPVPTLVMHGERDLLVPVAAGRWLAQQIPHATLVEWPDAAHLPFFTHREAFVAALESFVG